MIVMFWARAARRSRGGAVTVSGSLEQEVNNTKTSNVRILRIRVITIMGFFS
jgi:hypothetical protein